MNAPEELSGNALLAWHMFADQIGEIEERDRPALTVLAIAWAEMHDAQRQIENGGTIVKLPNGYPKPNPYCEIRDKARAVVLKLSAEFGLTPASRAKNKPKKAVDDDARIEF